MSWDGDYFNANSDGELRSRMYRLLRDAQPDSIDPQAVEFYQNTPEELFKYPPLQSEVATP